MIQFTPTFYRFLLILWQFVFWYHKSEKWVFPLPRKRKNMDKSYTANFQNADPGPSVSCALLAVQSFCSIPMSDNRYLNIFLLAVRNEKMWELQHKMKITLFIYNWVWSQKSSSKSMDSTHEQHCDFIAFGFNWLIHL